MAPTIEEMRTRKDLMDLALQARTIGAFKVYIAGMFHLDLLYVRVKLEKKQALTPGRDTARKLRALYREIKGR